MKIAEKNRAHRIGPYRCVLTAILTISRPPGRSSSIAGAPCSRVPREALASGKHPRREATRARAVVGDAPDEQPDTPIEKARWIAGNLGLRGSASDEPSKAARPRGGSIEREPLFDARPAAAPHACGQRAIAGEPSSAPPTDRDPRRRTLRRPSAITSLFMTGETTRGAPSPCTGAPSRCTCRGSKACRRAAHDAHVGPQAGRLSRSSVQRLEIDRQTRRPRLAVADHLEANVLPAVGQAAERGRQALPLGRSRTFPPRRRAEA